MSDDATVVLMRVTITLTQNRHGLDLRADVPLVLSAHLASAHDELRRSLRAGTLAPADLARWVCEAARADAIRRVGGLPVRGEYLFPMLLLDDWTDGLADALRVRRQRRLECLVRSDAGLLPGRRSARTSSMFGP